MDEPRTYESIVQTIHGTPLVHLGRLIPTDHATVLLKCEFFNPMNSIKDRIALAMIEGGIASGQISPDTLIVEPTSGNTGIALAHVCAAQGYKLCLAMPESMSLERRKLLHSLGARLELTPAAEGMPGAIQRASQIHEATSDSWMPRQFENPENPAVHQKTTGPEIWKDTDGQVDMIIAGVGTGGTITGVTRHLRSMNKDIKAIAVEPEASPVLSGGRPAPHRIQGIGAGFIPANCDTSLIDSIETIGNDAAEYWARQLALKEGIFAGVSTGANVCAAARIAARPENKGKVLVTFACSFGERYLSTSMFDSCTTTI
ncbi:MAG: cysteine synthase A [Phycisphaerae bacterium]|nr:cysteine synthase A [Phycisphaerae bacterium]